MPYRLFEELKRRHVFRATAVYLVVAWVILQLADIVVPALGLPEWVMTLVLALLVLCLPLAIVLAWIFDLTPQGLQRDGESASPPAAPPHPDTTSDGYRFGDCRLNVARRELTKSGAVVDVQPRVFDLLVFLVEHRDRAVSKDELQDAVWTGMVVTEASLTRAVMKLRQAVGDDASIQAVIKTVHGHGYRFVAPVEEPTEPAIAGASTRGEAVSARRPRRDGRNWWPILGGAVVVTVAAVSFVTMRVPDTSGTRIAVLPVQDATGDEDLAWTRLGLMSLATGLVETTGEIPVVPDNQVASVSGGAGSSDQSVVSDRLRRAYGATHILAMRLERSGGMLRMNYRVGMPDDRETRGTMVGEDPTDLTRGVVRSVIASIAGQRRMRERFGAVSVDPFVNEAYARGMSLSLEGRCRDARPLFQVAIDQEPGLFEPRYQYAYCSRILGEPEVAEAMLRELVEEQRELGPSRQLSMALTLLGVLHNRTGRLDEAEALENESLEVARAIDAPDLAGAVLVNLAIIADDRGQFEVARDRLGRALVAYKESGREVLPGQVYSALSNLSMSQGELDQAERNLARAIESFRFIGDRRNEAMMLNNKGYLRRLQGRLDEAETLHLESYAIREELGDRVGMGRIRNMLAVLYLARGDYESARMSAGESAAIAEETRDRLFHATALSHMGSAEMGLGDLDAAEERFRQSRKIFDEIQDRMRVLLTDIRLARVELERGSTEAAAGAADRLLAQARDGDFGMAEVEILELQGDVATAEHDPFGAIGRFGHALDRVREMSWTSKETDLSIKLAGAYLDEGMVAEAEPLLGFLDQQPRGLPGLRLAARFASIRDDPATAAMLMTEAKSLDDVRWSEADDEVLATYLERAETP